MLTDRLDHFIQLQQCVGQVLTDLRQRLPHAFGVQAHHQGDAVGQWITQVTQHPEPQPADTLTPRYQGQAQAQCLVLPAQQHVQLLVRQQGEFRRLQPSQGVEGRSVGHLGSQLFISCHGKVLGAQGATPLEPDRHGGQAAAVEATGWAGLRKASNAEPL